MLPDGPCWKYPINPYSLELSITTSVLLGFLLNISVNLRLLLEDLLPWIVLRGVNIGFGWFIPIFPCCCVVPDPAIG